MNLKTLETIVNIGLAAVTLKFGKSEVSFDLNSKSRIFKRKRKLNAEKKIISESFQEKKSGQIFSFKLSGGTLTFL